MSLFTTGINDSVYSVDLAILYVNHFKPKYIEDDIKKNGFYEDIYYNGGWNESEDENETIHPIDVINNPEKYEEHYERIVNADLDFPIMVFYDKKNKYQVFDGVHRISKAVWTKQKTIKTYVLDWSIIKKFEIGKMDVFYDDPFHYVYLMILKEIDDKIKFVYDPLNIKMKILKTTHDSIKNEREYKHLFETLFGLRFF